MITLPPVFFYAIGTLLVVFGALRVAVLGRRRADREMTDDTPERAKVRRRHRIWGVIWVAMGAFLIASTAGILGAALSRQRRRSTARSSIVLLHEIRLTRQIDVDPWRGFQPATAASAASAPAQGGSRGRSPSRQAWLNSNGQAVEDPRASNSSTERHRPARTGAAAGRRV